MYGCSFTINYDECYFILKMLTRSFNTLNEDERILGRRFIKKFGEYEDKKLKTVRKNNLDKCFKKFVRTVKY